MNPAETLLFVYGTLKRGGSNHRFLAGQKFLGAAHTVAGFTLYALDGYPGLVRAPDAAGVTGELWAVDAACLAKLDEFEGVDEGLYARETIALAPPFAATPAEAYVYLRSVAGRTHLGKTWRE